MENTGESKKIKISHESVIKLLREHSEMVKLLKSFPREIEGLAEWISKKNSTLAKATKKYTDD
jgi:hypothetical protein